MKKLNINLNIKFFKIFICVFVFSFIYNNAYAKINFNFETSKIEHINFSNCKIYYDNNFNTFNILKRNKVYIYKNFKLKNIVILKRKHIKDVKNIVSNKKIIILQTKKNIIAINKINSKLLWKELINEKLLFKPILSKNKLFLDKNGHTLIALNSNNGKLIWKYSSNIENFFIHTNGSILQTHDYVFYIYPNKKIITLKKKNGEKIQSHGICYDLKSTLHKSKKLKFITDIHIYNKIIYLCYGDGSFVVIHGLSGKVLWNKKKYNYKNVSVHKNEIIVVKKNGKLTLLNKFNGKKIWTSKLLVNKILSNPIILNENLIFVGDSNGILYCLQKDNGKILDKIKISNHKIKKVHEVKTGTLILLSENKSIIKIDI